MPRYTLAVVAGTLLAFYANALPDSSWFMFAPLLAWFALLQPRYRLLLLFAAAFLWSSAALHYHLDHRLTPAFDNRVSLLQGRVVDIPEVRAGRVRFYLQPDSIDAYRATLPRRVRLSWYQDRVLPRAGETWQFVARLRVPGGMQNPAGFDYAAWQFAQGIDAVGAVSESASNRRLAPAVAVGIDPWRDRIGEHIDRLCPGCAQAGVIKALAIGYRGDLGARQRDILQRSGTAHLLAISGLHIGLVAFFCLLLGKLCWRLGFYRLASDRMRFASLFALAGAAAYAALAGFSLPTLRALIMFAIIVLALRLGNRVNLLQSVSLAIALILLLDPRAVGSASLWLSASALLVIAFAQLCSGSVSGRWRQLLQLQAYFALLFLPLGLLLFERINPSGYVANLVAIPLLSCVLLPLLGLAGASAAAAAPWSGWLLLLADRLLTLLFDFLAWLDRGYLESITLAGIPPPLLGMMLAALLAWLLPVGWRLRGVALLLLGLALGWQPARLQQGAFELTVLDVGMGTSLLLRTREHSLVYDFGPGKAGVYSAADWALLPLLRQLRIDRPDLLVVSHVDQDHSGGLQSFIDDYAPAQLLAGTPTRLENRFGLKHRVRSCHDYPAWRWDGVDFRFLAADVVAAARDNNNLSCVLLVSGRHRALLPGDIESGQEARLLARFADSLDAEILVAPHHGSDTSSSPAFVRRVSPRYVVYTVARGNRWRFPRPAVEARYAAVGSRQLRTDLDGAIRLYSDAGGLALETYGSPARRLWRRW